MVSFFALATLAVLPAAFAQQLSVNTPQGVTVCQPVQITMTGGTAPYFLSFVPAGQSAAPPIKQFPQQTGNTFTWKADLPEGTTFTISLKDSTGAPAFSDTVTVGSGSDTSCLNTAVTEGGTGGSAAPTSGGSSGSSTGAGATTSGANPKPTSGTATASATASSASSSNAASNTKSNAVAIAGVMGLVGAALF